MAACVDAEISLTCALCRYAWSESNFGTRRSGESSLFSTECASKPDAGRYICPAMDRMKVSVKWEGARSKVNAVCLGREGREMMLNETIWDNIGKVLHLDIHR